MKLITIMRTNNATLYCMTEFSKGVSLNKMILLIFATIAKMNYTRDKIMAAINLMNFSY